MYSSENANAFAYFALAVFPVLAFFVFSRLRPVTAAVGLALGGAMFLPHDLTFDFPLLPPIGKESITYLSILACALYYTPRRLLAARPGLGIEALGLVMAFGAIMTVMLNDDPIRYGPTVLPGVPIRDLWAAAIDDVLIFALPAFLGRVYLRDAEDLRLVLRLFVLAGLVYSVGILWELRMAPSLHLMTYGYHPNSMSKSLRYGGYRPMMFMPSGIAVGVFMATTVIAAVGLAKAKVPLAILSARQLAISGLRRVRIGGHQVAGYLLVILIACKSMASIGWGVMFYPLITVFRWRMLALAALLGCVLVLSYPATRLAGLIPLDRIVETISRYDTVRARSLGGRFNAENLMLAKAMDRPLFGWGAYQRNWAFDEDTGRFLVVPDGFWVIQVSGRGLVGFGTAFGLLVVPVLVSLRWLRRVPGRRERQLLAVLCIVIVVRAMDQLPNGFYSSHPIFVASGLMAMSRALARGPRRARARPTAERVLAPSPGPTPAPAPAGLGQGLRQASRPRLP